MSLYGKILAVLNIFGAAAFVYFAFADFTKREAWAYDNYVYDVVVNGLPLDDAVKDNRENPVVPILTNDTKTEWFGNDKVSTQVEEVDRVKNAVNAKVDALPSGSPAQTVELTRILKPFAQHNDEREYLIALQTYLSTPDGEARLDKRLHDAFPAAVQAYQTHPEALTFPAAFETACRAQGGPPAESFETTFLKLLPAKPERTFAAAVAEAKKVTEPTNIEQEAHNRALAFLRSLRDDPKATLRNLRDDPKTNKDTLDEVFQQTLTAVHEQLKAQLDGLVDEARNGPKAAGNSNERLRDIQRFAVAHLLFNTVDILQDAVADKDANARAYARVTAVVGLTADLREINAQAALLQQIGEELNGDRTLELSQFTAAHRARIDELQNRAVVLHDALDLLARKKQALTEGEAAVRTRQDVVNKYQADLAEARAKTEKQITDLRNDSETLLQLRVKGRDALSENLNLERQIRDLEKKH